MKYIKLYEEISDEYYYQLNYQDYCVLRQGAIDLNLSDSQIDKINLIMNNPSIYFEYQRYLNSPSTIEYMVIKVPNIKVGNIEIYRLSDEWFLIEFPGKNLMNVTPNIYLTNDGMIGMFYCKCDQFEGVLQFLKDYVIFK